MIFLALSPHRVFIKSPFFLFLQVLAWQGLASHNRKSAKIFLAMGPPPLLYSRLMTNVHMYRIGQSAVSFQISAISGQISEVSDQLHAES
jgi:hypothetical protein